MKIFIPAALLVACILVCSSSAETIQQAKQRREKALQEHATQYHNELRRKQEKSIAALRYPKNPSFQPTNPDDIAAMEAFYKATNGPKWNNNTGWLKGDPCKDPFWYGLYCIDGRVLQMNIVGNGLMGSIPPELAKASALQIVRLYSNLLTGMIPSEIFTMQSLQTFDVSGNQLSMTLPQTISMANLKELVLYQNQITGNIPYTFNTPKLETLEVSSNMLTGELPPSLSNCPNLKVLIVSRNMLTGSLPASYGSLAKLQRLWIFENNFDQPNIPDSWRGMTALQEFQAEGLSGKMPSWLGDWTELTLFVVINGKIEGEFPTSLCQCNNMVTLRVFNNSLSGEVPRCICSYRSLQDFEVSDNLFTGPVPDCIGDVTSLNLLYFSRNNLSGEFPQSIGQLTKLNVLDVSSNMMYGTIPNTINGLSNEIAEFAVAYNKFSQIEEGADDFWNRIKNFGCVFYSNPWSCPLPSGIPKSCGAVCSKCNSGSKHTDCNACIKDESCGWCNEGPNCLEAEGNGPYDIYRCLPGDWTSSGSTCP